MSCFASTNWVPCNPIQELACRCLGAAQWMNPLMTNLVCLPCLHIQPGIVYLRPLLLLLSLRFCSPKQHFTFIVLLAFFQFSKQAAQWHNLHKGTLFLIHTNPYELGQILDPVRIITSEHGRSATPRELPGREDLSTICVQAAGNVLPIWNVHPSFTQNRLGRENCSTQPGEFVDELFPKPFHIQNISKVGSSSWSPIRPARSTAFQLCSM